MENVRKKIDFIPLLKEYRNYWYNPDYLDLMAERWELSNNKRILDVGCGLFHWSRLISKYFPDDTEIIGIDILKLETEVINEIKELNDFLNKKIEYYQGNAEDLPFPDESFDLVTCQTLLIHLHDPFIALEEMKRILKPGGKIICSEPNNSMQSLINNSYNRYDKNKARIKSVKNKLRKETKKINNKNGNDSIGELVPLIMHEINMDNIHCYMNDKIISLNPPYSTEEQKNKIKMITNLKYHCPHKLNKSDKQEINNILELIGSNEFYSYGPTMLFLTSGEKKNI